VHMTAWLVCGRMQATIPPHAPITSLVSGHVSSAATCHQRPRVGHVASQPGHVAAQPDHAASQPHTTPPHSRVVCCAAAASLPSREILRVAELRSASEETPPSYADGAADWRTLYIDGVMRV